VTIQILYVLAYSSKLCGGNENWNISENFLELFPFTSYQNISNRSRGMSCPQMNIWGKFNRHTVELGKCQKPDAQITSRIELM